MNALTVNADFSASLTSEERKEFRVDRLELNSVYSLPSTETPASSLAARAIDKLSESKRYALDRRGGNIPLQLP